MADIGSRLLGLQIRYRAGISQNLGCSRRDAILTRLEPNAPSAHKGSGPSLLFATGGTTDIVIVALFWTPANPIT